MSFRSGFALFLVFATWPAQALEWEIERNFRYFAYPSDIAAQRVARDLYLAKNGAAPTPEQSERQMNDAGFWSTEVAYAADLAKRWPIDWPRVGTIYDLVKRLRQDERRVLPVGPEELARGGWASLIAPGPSPREPTGATDTCWDPAKRLHSHCPQWGDYVRPSGWVLRIFDPGAPAGRTCQWTLDGAVFADGPGSWRRRGQGDPPPPRRPACAGRQGGRRARGHAAHPIRRDRGGASPTASS